MEDYNEFNIKYLRFLVFLLFFLFSLFFCMCSVATKFNSLQFVTLTQYTQFMPHYTPI